MKHPVRRAAAAMLLAGFLLGIRNGQVALWRGDDPEPVRVFPWYSSMLPGQIRSALENGLRIEEESDIGKLIQDMIG